MSFLISKWFDSYHTPVNLMIDDLNDVYIDIYKESYKNDWGYLCLSKDSIYSFLKKNLLDKFPYIKITFFVPYLEHNVVNKTLNNYKKYAIGDREEFQEFLLELLSKGHEIAHHGSNHGEYIDENNPDTNNNFKHEWELFETVEEGVTRTVLGKNIFKKYLDIDIVGGKFCGYLMRENSLEIIDKSQFQYWCIDAKLDLNDSDTFLFGTNQVISIPTNFNGNAFVRLKYKTGRLKRDMLKLFTQFFQPLYNIWEYKRLNSLYIQRDIITIQEHISPSTSSGGIQASNIVSDIKSLQKIFNFLSKKSIWYATCKEIANYIYTRDNSKIEILDNKINIVFNNYKKLKNSFITIENSRFFILENNIGDRYIAREREEAFYITLAIDNGINEYGIVEYAK